LLKIICLISLGFTIAGSVLFYRASSGLLASRKIDCSEAESRLRTNRLKSLLVTGLGLLSGSIALQASALFLHSERYWIRGTALLGGQFMYFIYLAATDLLAIWLAVCIFWALRQVARTLFWAKSILLVVALCALATSTLAQVTPPVSVPAHPTIDDVYRAYIDAEMEYRIAAESYKSATDSYKTMTRSQGTSKATDSAGEDLWSHPAFQQLMATLWQAPLTILAIVLAIGGIIGWQGYQDIKKNLFQLLRERNEQLKAEVEYQANLTIARGDLTAALYSWELAFELAKQQMVKEGKQLDIYKQFPPEVFDETCHATPHMRAAKRLALRAVRAVNRVPAELPIEVFGQPKEVFKMEAQQSCAYYIATDYRKAAEEGLWIRALNYSDQARKVLDDEKWMTQQKLDKRIKGPLWYDTFIYVRVIYSKSNPTVPEAMYQFEQSRKVYSILKQAGDPAYSKLLERFSAVFS
jgi:hypothetical protein